MLAIRRAAASDFGAVRAFYHSMIDAMAAAEYKPGWEKDVYPAPDFLREAVAAGTLWLGELDGKLAACMVVDHGCNEGYGDIAWPTAAPPGEVSVIHALGVHPDFAGRGLGRAMVEHAVAAARGERQKALRLDVLKGNVPARRLYEGAGFRYIATLPMYYPDTGRAEFELFELKLS